MPRRGPGQDQAAGAVQPAAWTTSAGAAAEVEPGTAPASPANAPNLDYETLPGAAPRRRAMKSTSRATFLPLSGARSWALLASSLPRRPRQS
jgi:hypothetical protein